jgi:2-hydroxymuconate-semialdehyde hydrolase
MKPFWLAFPWFATGCAAVAVDVSGTRLTPFRTELLREGSLREVELDGYRHCIVERGSGPPLVLLHGLGGSIYDWRHLIRPLGESHRVIAIDLLGAGESDLPENADYSIAAQARRVKGLMELLGVERASVVGNSYGGGIALRLAQDWPDRVDRLVLINSICYPEHVPAYVSLVKAPCAECVAETLPLGKMTRWVLRGCYKTVERLSEEELDTYIAELRAPGRRAAIVRVVRAVVPPDTREFEARLKSIRAPSLLIWGSADPTVPVELGRRLAKDLPNARLVEVEAGHVPNQEIPEDVLRLMEGFLR